MFLVKSLGFFFAFVLSFNVVLSEFVKIVYTENNKTIYDESAFGRLEESANLTSNYFFVLSIGSTAESNKTEVVISCLTYFYQKVSF